MSEIAKHWIDGEWTGSGPVKESVNPATGAKGAPTPDYTEFETFTLIRPRS